MTPSMSELGIKCHDKIRMVFFFYRLQVAAFNGVFFSTLTPSVQQKIQPAGISKFTLFDALLNLNGNNICISNQCLLILPLI